MRNPKVVLGNLSSKSKDSNYTFQNLYRNLYNPEFYLMAYQKIYANEGNMTEGTDGNTIDGMSLERINKIIEKIKNESYQPNPARRTYIPKKNGGKRPLGIPSFDDKLVQEIVRNILESIYENKFSDRSHGFRPNRSCHTALKQIKSTFTGTRWFIEGDIKGFFDNIDHSILINILRKHIKDEKFIRLMWKFLKAGYVEDWVYKNTYSGTPQGGIISPILSNIYLNELDSYMESYKKNFDKGKERKRNPVYRNLEYRIGKIKKDNMEKWKDMNQEEKNKVLEEIKKLQQQKSITDHYLPMDDNYKRLQYVRYADDFIIGITGSKEEAKEIKKDLTNFLNRKLKLELSQEKTLITNTKDRARFLGYDIYVSRSQATVTRKDGAKVRSHNLVVKLLVPKEKWIQKLKDNRAIEIVNDSILRPIAITNLINLDDLEIISLYNSQIEGLYNYYCLAHNVRSLSKFSYFMEYSMYRTYARKYKISKNKIIAKYNINGKFGIKYNTKKGEKIRFFYDKGFKVKDEVFKNASVDDKPNINIYVGSNSRTSMIDRLKAEKCEWCGKTNVPLEMHHTKKLKDLKGKKQWEKFMIARNRKTIAICKKCHDDLHAGRLD